MAGKVRFCNKSTLYASQKNYFLIKVGIKNWPKALLFDKKVSNFTAESVFYTHILNYCLGI